MIAWDIAGPTPGRVWSCSAVAWFTSTGVGKGRATARGLTFATVAAGTPAPERSSRASYGRPSMIFLAVASPTPGRVMRSSAEAEFTSTRSAFTAGFGFGFSLDFVGGGGGFGVFAGGGGSPGHRGA